MKLNLRSRRTIYKLFIHWHSNWSCAAGEGQNYRIGNLLTLKLKVRHRRKLYKFVIHWYWIEGAPQANNYKSLLRWIWNQICYEVFLFFLLWSWKFYWLLNDTKIVRSGAGEKIINWWFFYYWNWRWGAGGNFQNWLFINVETKRCSHRLKLCNFAIHWQWIHCRLDLFLPLRKFSLPLEELLLPLKGFIFATFKNP